MSDSNQLPPLGHASANTWLDWSREALEGMENLLRLNLGQARSLADDAFAHAHALLEARDAQEMIALQFNVLQPLAEKAVAYYDRAYGITSEAAAELNRLAEKQMEQAQEEMAAAVDQAFKHSPADTNSASALLRSMFDATNQALSALQPATIAALNAEPARAMAQPATKRRAPARRSAKSAAKTRRSTARRS